MVEESLELQDQRQVLLQQNPEFAPKELWEREVDGMHQAMHFIQRKARGIHDGGLDREDIFKIHKFAMNDPFNPERTGVLRDRPVIVRGRINGEVKEAAFTPENTYFLSEYFNEFASELDDKTSGLSAKSTVEEVIDLASWAHKRFIEIHPFEDGNGRTARLIVDFIFRKARLPYIRDWGAERHEYDEVVYRIYSEKNLDLLKTFLARKLLRRLQEMDTRGNSILDEYVNSRKTETEDYLNQLQVHAA